LVEVADEGTLIEDIREVEKAAGRCQKIIENLLDFSRGDTGDKRIAVSLNEIVRRTLPMLKTAVREHRSEIAFGESEDPIWVEPHLMQQVVFNLVNNACQAMNDPGTITVETETAFDASGRAVSVLHVKDTGVGIPPEIIESIFEPFFTTKERGQGTGLGLSMSRSVIEEFGGKIEVTSRAGHGAHFTVRLPLMVDAKKPPRQG
jgi:signal transduction histidine kinase